MPWCPYCSTELSTQKRKCPECKTPVSKGPGFTTPIEYLDREWCAIRVLDDVDEVENLRKFLESKGIDVAVQNGNGALTGKIKPNGKSRTSMVVLVPIDLAPRAASLVRNFDWNAHDEFVDLGREILMDGDDFDFEDDYIDDSDDYLGTSISLDGFDDFDDCDF